MYRDVCVVGRFHFTPISRLWFLCSQCATPRDMKVITVNQGRSLNLFICIDPNIHDLPGILNAYSLITVHCHFYTFTAVSTETMTQAGAVTESYKSRFKIQMLLFCYNVQVQIYGHYTLIKSTSDCWHDSHLICD